MRKILTRQNQLDRLRWSLAYILYRLHCAKNAFNEPIDDTMNQYKLSQILNSDFSLDLAVGGIIPRESINTFFTSDLTKDHITKFIKLLNEATTSERPDESIRIYIQDTAFAFGLTPTTRSSYDFEKLKRPNNSIVEVVQQAVSESDSIGLIFDPNMGKMALAFLRSARHSGIKRIYTHLDLSKNSDDGFGSPIDEAINTIVDNDYWPQRRLAKLLKYMFLPSDFGFEALPDEIACDPGPQASLTVAFTKSDQIVDSQPSPLIVIAASNFHFKNGTNRLARIHVNNLNYMSSFLIAYSAKNLSYPEQQTLFTTGSWSNASTLGQIQSKDLKKAHLGTICRKLIQKAAPSLSDIANIRVGIPGEGPQKIKIVNLTGNHIIAESYPKDENKADERTHLMVGDIILPIMAFDVGKISIVTDKNGNTIDRTLTHLLPSNNLVIIRLIHKKWDPYYLFLQLRYGLIGQILNEIAKTGSVTVGRINLSEVKSLPVFGHESVHNQWEYVRLYKAYRESLDKHLDLLVTETI